MSTGLRDPKPPREEPRATFGVRLKPSDRATDRDDGHADVRREALEVKLAPMAPALPRKKTEIQREALQVKLKSRDRGCAARGNR